ncbi:hypothetical protein C8R45DRAFT_364902 [Mycena sanguinolenta]|nr:hypothetical protein C8R45DRAFT_364902 [Mycena sanguinolenta]
MRLAVSSPRCRRIHFALPRLYLGLAASLRAHTISTTVRASSTLSSPTTARRDSGAPDAQNRPGHTRPRPAIAYCPGRASKRIGWLDSHHAHRSAPSSASSCLLSRYVPAGCGRMTRVPAFLRL